MQFLLLEMDIIVVCIILAIQTYWDIRYREIPVMVTLIGGILGLLLFFFSDRSLIDLLLAILLGVIFLVIGKLSREAIGYGDGMLLCMMGLYFSAENLWSLCILAFIFAGIVALVFLIFFRKKGNYELPFVPFLLLATIVFQIGRWM